ncbi:MAG: hypothetical protein OXM56_04030 [Gammaproteobacteria bacterium]|nr:hypothetical protein [Gammaproteobacteria bacterium]
MNRVKTVVERLRARVGARRFNWLSTLLLIGVGSLTVHVLIRDELHTSALLYVGLPFAGALAITVLRPAAGTGVWRRYLDFSLTSLVVLLGSSIVLFEGFVCVLMFLPIYFLVTTACFVFLWLWERIGARGNRNFLAVLPLVILASSLEGTTEATSFERVNQATAITTAALTPQEIMANLTRPIDLDADRHWLLSVFPMPYLVEAESIAPGAVHRVHTRYHRWFVANTREGMLRLEILEAEPTRIRTRIVDDTTFYATYLTQIGTEIELTPLDGGQTEISLRIEYRRNLDPAWYFHPLQQFAMRRMGEFFIEQAMVRSRDGQYPAHRTVEGSDKPPDV